MVMHQLQNSKNHIRFYANIDEISDDAITLPDTDELASKPLHKNSVQKLKKVEND